MKNLRPNAHRAKYALFMILIVMAADIISAISGYLQFDLLKSVEDGKLFFPETFENNDLRERIIGITSMIVFIISAVTFIMWFRRAYYNLGKKTIYLRFSDDWAAGSWFVPIISFYRPFQMMKQLFQETKKVLSLNKIKTNLSTDIVVWWWTLWLINSFVGQFVFRYSMRADTLDELLISTKVGILNNLLGIPLAVVAAKLIKEYSNVEPLLFEEKIEASNIDLSQ